jgi:Holliday junction DNA helicase RuvA
VAREDKALVGRANGVGPKLAQRIVVELKDKSIGGGDIAGFHAQVSATAAAVVPSVAGDAVVALMGLGTPETVGRRAVEKVLERLGETAPLQAVIKGALQELGR